MPDCKAHLTISSRETIPSLICRLNVPNFFSIPEYDGTLFRSRTFQFANTFWFFEFLSDERWSIEEEVSEDDSDYDLRSFNVNLVRLNSVIQQQIYSIVTVLDANDKKCLYDWNSSLFKEHEDKFQIAYFDSDDTCHRSEYLSLIIDLFREESVEPDNDEIQNTTNGDLETETTIEEKNCNVTLELSTRKNISSVACTLKIPNFFIMTECDGTIFETRTLAFANAAWCFRFYSNERWNSEDDIHDKKIGFGARMVRLDFELPEQRIFYTIAILDNNDQQYEKETDCELFEESHNSNNLWYFWNTKSCFDRRDSLTLIIRLFYDKSMEKENNTQRGVERLLQNFKSLLLDEQSSDVVLKIENRDFKAHKTILSARSPVFASMFQPYTKESTTGIVDIPDCSASAFEIFLLYTYTGSADAISSDIVCDLYYVADKYQMDDLKSECAHFMEYNLSVDNFCEIMTLSLQHNEKGLQKTAIEYFCANVKTIIKTVQWQKYLKEYSTQANELYIKAINA